MFIVVYECSNCGKKHYNSSNMKKHVGSVCSGAHLQKRQGVVVVDGHAETLTRSKPGPKPVNVQAVLNGRFPAFSDDGDDERIEYIFASGCIEDLLKTPCEDIPAFLYRVLWSMDAPIHLQSLVMHKGLIHEILTLDEETGEVTFTNRGTLTRRFIKEMAVYTLELAYAIVKDSVPARLTERTPEAQHLMHALRDTTNGMTLRDALKATGGYTKKSFALRHKLDTTLTKLHQGMISSFPTCFSSI